MKVVITGANGFVGRAWLDSHMALRAAGDPVHQALEIHAVLRSTRSMSAFATDYPDVPIVTDEEGGLDETLRDAHAVVHLAWSSVPVSANADPLKDLRDNVDASLTLIEACGRARVRRFIFLSSGGTVYGTAGTAPHVETSSLQPVGAYGAAKACVEHYLQLRAEHYSFGAVVLRPGNLYGSRLAAKKDQGVVEHWMDALREGRAIAVWNGLDVVRDYVFIDDLVGTIMAAIEAPEFPTVLNVGTGVGTSLAQLRDLLGGIAGSELALDMRGISPPAIPWNVLDTGLRRRVLPGIEFTPLSKGLARAWTMRARKAAD